jgi:nitroimidazol reductase NimA-like FMN-containing flavoprotein (pyridoxamine 5'-phosphate oxidase superfamily)
LSYTGQAPSLTSEEIESLLKENNTARICTTTKTEPYMPFLSVTDT